MKKIQENMYQFNLKFQGVVYVINAFKICANVQIDGDLILLRNVKNEYVIIVFRLQKKLLERMSVLPVVMMVRNIEQFQIT